MAKPFNEMNDQEKVAAYNELMNKRNTRKAGSQAKRMATKALITAHEPEYKKLLAEAEKKVKAGETAPAKS